MAFSTSTTIKSKRSVSELKQSLVGKHVFIHNLDFEVVEADGKIKLIPHAETENKLRTLPITHINVNPEGDQSSNIKVTSKMRRIDSGGPILVASFSVFMFIGAILFWVYGGQDYSTFSIVLLSIGLLTAGLLYYRLQVGYYDTVRKIRRYIKTSVA